MLHPHLEMYGTAIKIMRRIEAIMKARGIESNENSIFYDPSFDPLNPLHTANKFGYMHVVDPKPNMSLQWSLVYHSDDEVAGSLIVEIDLVFNDNPANIDSWKLSLQYEIAKKVWQIEYLDLITAKQTPIKSSKGENFIRTLGLKKSVSKTIHFSQAISAICKIANFYAT